jgi:hypothetical protein
MEWTGDYSVANKRVWTRAPQWVPPPVSEPRPAAQRVRPRPIATGTYSVLFSFGIILLLTPGNRTFACELGNRRSKAAAATLKRLCQMSQILRRLPPRTKPSFQTYKTRYRVKDSLFRIPGKMLIWEVKDLPKPRSTQSSQRLRIDTPRESERERERTRYRERERN